MRYRIALAQIDPVLGDLQANVGKHVEMIDRALTGGADLVVFPELSLSGYGIKDLTWDLAIRPDAPSDLLRPLADRSRDISIIAGGVEESEAYGLYNSAFILEGGRIRSAHRKVYPPTYGMFEEMRYFSQGSSVKATDTRVGRLGVLICEDLWHISLPYVLALDGAETIISLVASPTRLGGDGEVLRAVEVNRENHRAYARLLSAWVVFCNRVGFEDGVNFWGGSAVVAPDGNIAAEATVFAEDLVFAEIDSNDVRRARRFSRHFLDEDSELVRRELNRIAGR
jgi:NAD+ synthase (glutamine-hydrolysing)